MITSLSNDSLPLPVVLTVRRDLYAMYEQMLALHSAPHEQVLSVIVEFGLIAYSQLQLDARKGELSDVLMQRLSLPDSLSHRCGVALLETERAILLTEALAIEAKRLIARARETQQQLEGGK